jgi:hypothetical protein
LCPKAPGQELLKINVVRLLRQVPAYAEAVDHISYLTGTLKDMAQSDSKSKRRCGEQGALEVGALVEFLLVAFLGDSRELVAVGIGLLNTDDKQWQNAVKVCCMKHMQCKLQPLTPVLLYVTTAAMLDQS